MARLAPAAAIAAALLLLAPALAGARGPSTPAERRRAVETTRRLERDPAGKSADASRRWLLQWIVEIPDIHVTGCSGPLDGLVQDERPFGKELYAQSVFGMAAYLVENPKGPRDWVTVQAAGVKSVLAAYRSLLRSAPEARREELDLLTAADGQGRLEEIIEETMEGCGDERAPAPGEAI